MVAGVAVLWGSIGVVVRQVDLPAVAIVTARVWVASAVLAVWLVVRGRDSPGARLFAWRRPLVVLAGLVLAGHWVALFAALQRAPIGTVLLVTYLAPVGVAVLAPAVLGERASRQVAVALALGVGGIALIASPSISSPDGPGLGLAVLSAALLVALSLLSKSLSRGYGGGQLALQELAVAAVALAPFAVAATWGPPSTTWAWLLVLGAIHTAVAYWVYLTAMEVLPITQISVLLYLEPASAIAYGWLLLDERPTLTTLLGGLLVVAAGLLVLGRRRTIDDRQGTLVVPG